jgi:hypothetical protein
LIIYAAISRSIRLAFAFLPAERSREPTTAVRGLLTQRCKPPVRQRLECGLVANLNVNQPVITRDVIRRLVVIRRLGVIG